MESVEELLGLANEDPDATVRRATALLAGTSDPRARSFAHHALGIVHRDRGRIPEALAALRAGIADARRSGDADRERDVRATYGTTLVFAGRTTAGLADLTRACAGAQGAVGAQVQLRYGGTLAVVGRFADALPVLTAARDGAAEAGLPLWEARARIWLGHVHLALGQVDLAEREVVAGERVLAAEGAAVERLKAVENLAEIAGARGDLAACLRIYGEVLAAHRAAGRPSRFEAVALHAAAYRRAGLAPEAARLLRDYGASTTLAPHEDAQFRLALAEALLAAGAPEEALVEARAARDRFVRQGRTWFALRARLVALQVRGGPAEARAVADALDAEGADEAPLALTLAGRLGPADARHGAWERAAAYRRNPNALVRAGAWQARALDREAYGDRGGVLRAAAAGLDALDEHRRLIGSSELRALATAHGRELTALALRHAAQDPRSLLRWSERTRATALAQPPATSDAGSTSAALAALRDNGRRLTEARREGAPVEDLERERRRLERAVRAESHQQTAAAARHRGVSVDEVLAATAADDTCLVELVDVDGVLHVLVAHRGTVRRRVAGATADVTALLGPAGMLLRRAARGRPADPAAIGRRLEEAVLGDAVRLLPDGPVVLAPTARLHGLAWSLLPALDARPFAVVPSAGQWLRARAARPGAGADVGTVLVAGPDLASGGAEVPVLAARHPEAVLLDGDRATVEAVLAHLDGARLAHLATHGRFRADSPLFSALDLADGPLTVHDLERLARAPYRVVLSACESGVLAPVGADELLGLAAALFALGTAGLVSSVGEVNDAATAALMVDLHAALAAGSDPAAALLAVRRRTAGDAVAAGTAAAFVALGV
ncbi:CHAT domain-containing protein [Pimelobacter simplex]|uniref:CHAT domain-containing protein n=1 Tax=Nocardioides simplex TaxID=2045 RepID=UPI0021502458|nr:CHAT domain-containing protein [Pimelobacter simplex]UUW90694.1 CHAT domain-containing protein [Pimelobacter simplex]UUW94523.1 CHAT domain-containing protein [Pimelobacter simplex]